MVAEVEFLGDNDIPYVTDCDKCLALCDARHTIVNGHGAENPDILFVGQAPDDDEDRDKSNYNRQGQPFIGRSGQLLRYLCDAAGVPIRRTRRVLAVRCHTKGNLAPKSAEIEACNDFLYQEIESTQPKLIVGLGAVAFDALYLTPRHREAMEWYQQNDIPQWEAACMREEIDYAGAIAGWEIACEVWKAAGGKKGTNQGKPPKPPRPKMPKKPLPPKREKIPLGDIVGISLEHPGTGLPLMITYHPRWLMRGKWGQCDLVVSHLKKAARFADGEQTVGQLGDYHTAKTVKQVQRLGEYLLRPEVDTIFFDCETVGPPDKPTDGTNWMRAELLCISFATKAGEGFVIPVLHNDGSGYPVPFWTAEAWRKVVKVIRRIFASDKPKTGHNMLFDVAILSRKRQWAFIDAVTAFGFEINGYWADTELSHQMVAETLPHNMTSVLATHTDMPYYETEVHKGLGKKRMDLLPDEVLWYYSAADADGLPRMQEELYKIILAEGTDFVLEEIANPMLRMCWNMQVAGLPINEEYFDRLCRFYSARIAEKEAELWDICAEYDIPAPFRYTYPADLQDVLFTRLGLPTPDRRTKSSKTCEACAKGVCFKHIETGKDALRDIQEMAPHPILDVILDLKGLHKVKGTYLDGTNGQKGWKAHIKPDGRIHPTVQVSRVETGRLAFKRPSAQNPPKGIHIHPIGGSKVCHDPKCKAYYEETFGIDTTNAFRDVIEAFEGKGIMNVDWNQLEVWGIGYMLRDLFDDTTLLDVLLSGRDIHTFAARGSYPELDPDMSDGEWRDVHKDLRDAAKPLVFGTNYGLTVNGYMERAHVDEETAKDRIGRYERAVPGLPKYKNWVRERLIRHKSIFNKFGRKRHADSVDILRQMNEKNEVEGLFREFLNMPIQGVGTDLHSYVSVATDEWRALQARGVRAILSVHDSLTFEFDWPDNEYALQTAWLIKDFWQKLAWSMPTPEGPPLHWKVVCEVEWGKRWGTPEWKLNAGGVLQDLSKEEAA